MAAPTSPDRILDIGESFWKAKALMSAVEFDVFTILSADGALSLDEICERTGLNHRGARDFLDALVALALLDRDDAGTYSNSADSDLFLDRRKPTYSGGFIEMCNARLYSAWGGLTHALRTGKSVHASDADHPDFYSHRVYADERSRKTFVAGMTGTTRAIARALLGRFPWQRHTTVVDIGCAQGALLVEIANHYPHLRGVGFDLHPVAPLFEEFVAAAALTERVEFRSGDFRVDPFPAADVIVLGRVLHNWNLPTKLDLLRKAKASLRPGGSVIVYERLIDDDRRTHAAALLASLNMQVVTPEGFDFTGADCTRWMLETGFHGISVAPLAANHSMVVGVA